MSDGWQESTGLGETWNYKEGGEGATIEGVYMGFEDNIGPNNSRMHYIEVLGKGIVNVWGNAIIDQRVKNFKVGGEMVKIVYKGMKKSEKTKREYHDFGIFHKAYTPGYQETKSQEEVDEFEKEMGLK